MKQEPYDIVVLDCDSTLTSIEGIDELARRANVYEACCELTDAAMEGGVPLEKVYGQRLELIRPCESEIEWLGHYYFKHLTPGAEDLVNTLQENGKRVCVVSGGLKQAVLIMTEALKIPADNVFAVDIYFDSDGAYRGFDQDSQISRSGGKAEIVRQLKADGKSVVGIGDGITDLEMKMEGVTFIGFGGVRVRDKVKKGADIFIDDPSLLIALQYIET